MDYQYNANQYTADQYNANQYNTDQYNANQYNTDQYNANQYNADKISSQLMWIIGGASLGAIAMYLADPERGRRRRALATDKMYSMASETRHAISVASRDLSNRTHGLRAQASSMLTKGRTAVDDQVLIARVRQKLGRVVSHPRAINVNAQQGCIILSGQILAHEKQQLLDTVHHVRGVTDVEDRLDVHEQADGISRLQGTGKLRESAMQNSWPPAARAVATVGGGLLTIIGLANRTAVGTLCAAAGVGLMVRGVADMPLSQVASMSTEGKPVILNKTIHIAASPEQVFDLWSNYENFPRFMSRVREVRDIGNQRSHWVVRGPAGTQVEWDAELTESRRPEVLAWRSDPGSTIRNSGMIRFEPEGSGTRVNVHMSYTPPAGPLGHTFASLLGGDPKRQMDEDLMRMKAFIETGKPPHDAAQPSSQAPSTLH